ncbi:MAG: hypothetical protein AB8B95_16255 [Pseudohongiellaceae bacterium]
MKISLRQIAISLTGLIVSVAILIVIVGDPAAVGTQPLFVRALIVSLAILAALAAVYPFNPVFSQRPLSYIIAVCMPAILPVFVYYLFLLPDIAEQGVVAEQLSSALITDSSSNGLVEVGFSYPIYTPTIKLTNSGLFTEQVNVFLRMIDANGESALFRAVRDRVPGSALSVESSVRGLLSESDGPLFLPIAVPPVGSIAGQLVFIISNLDDGSSFTDALSSASQASFELRSPETGSLIHEFPLDRI